MRFSCVRERYRPRDLPLQVEPQSAPETTGAIFLPEPLGSPTRQKRPQGAWGDGGVFKNRAKGLVDVVGPNAAMRPQRVLSISTAPMMRD